MGPEPFNIWPEVYKDSQIEIRRNPIDPREYSLDLSGNCSRPLLLPRGTLPEIARGSLEQGVQVLENLDSELLEHFNSIAKKRLRVNSLGDYFSHSLLAAIKTAYISEEERRQAWIASRKE